MKTCARFFSTGLCATLALAACTTPMKEPSKNIENWKSHDPHDERFSPSPESPQMAQPRPTLSVGPSIGLDPSSNQPIGSLSPLLNFAGTFLLNAGGQILSNNGGNALEKPAGEIHPSVSGALMRAVASMLSSASLIGDSSGELISGDGGVDFYRLLTVADGVATADRSPPDLSKATFDAVFPDGNASRVVIIRHAPVSVKLSLVKGSEATVQGQLHQMAHLTLNGSSYSSRLVESFWMYEGTPLGATALELENPDGSLIFRRSYPLVPALAPEPMASGTYRLRLKGPMPAAAYGLLTIGERSAWRRAGQNGQMEAPAPEGWTNPGASVRANAFFPADTAASAAVLRHTYFLGGGKK